jgi:hypothetical protein
MSAEMTKAEELELTPRTDSEQYCVGQGPHSQVVSADFARSLERELNKVTRWAEIACEMQRNAHGFK